MTSSTLSIVESIRSAVKPSDLCCRKASTPVLYASKICPLITTSAATADGPRDALLQWQLKSTTNRSIWVYGRPTCNKLCAPSYSVDRRAVNKLDRRRVLLTIRSTCHGEIFQVRRLGQNFRRKWRQSSSIRSAISTELRLITDTDRQTRTDTDTRP